MFACELLITCSRKPCQHVSVTLSLESDGAHIAGIMFGSHGCKQCRTMYEDTCVQHVKHANIFHSDFGNRACGKLDANAIELPGLQQSVWELLHVGAVCWLPSKLDASESSGVSPHTGDLDATLEPAVPVPTLLFECVYLYIYIYICRERYIQIFVHVKDQLLLTSDG